VRVRALEYRSDLRSVASSIVGVAQLVDVQRYLQDAGVGTIVGPPVNIGITNEAGDWTRDGTYIYPGSMTVGADTFVRLYIDLLRSSMTTACGACSSSQGTWAGGIL
jgi:hypothetical protein